MHACLLLLLLQSLLDSVNEQEKALLIWEAAGREVKAKEVPWGGGLQCLPAW
jgi:hypothetical protein